MPFLSETGGKQPGPDDIVIASWSSCGRTMTLCDPVIWQDADGKTWTAPAGAVIDGASIPRFFWRVAGGPFTGRYRVASVVHDVYCVERTESSKDVHWMFLQCMLECGVSRWRAFLFWAAVRVFGPRFKGGGGSAEESDKAKA